MGYKTIEEMTSSIKDYARNFQKNISDDFPVHPDYLIDGMNERLFREAYKKYQNIILELQLHMADKPQEYGLVSYDKKGMEKPAYSLNNQYIWLFLALMQSGDVKNNTLDINGNKFSEFINGKAVGKNTASPKNIDNLLENLKNHSFLINGDINGDFALSSSIPYLLSVIKASTLTKYAKISMTSDYPTFNYKMYEFGIDDKLPIESTHAYSIMTDYQKEFTSKLINGLSENGWKSFIYFPHNPECFRLTFPTLEYYYNPSGGHIYIRNDKQTLKLIPYMESLPEKYGTLWEVATKCRGCRKGECKSRLIVDSFFGKKAALCNGSKPIYACKVEDVPHIMEAAMVTAGKLKT